jgi:hypothetical protein
VVLIEVLHHRAAGGARGTYLVPVEVSLYAPIRGARSWRRCAARLAVDPRIHRAAADAAAQETTTVQWQAAAQRVEELWLEERARGAAPQVQPSLFDRRAIRTAERQQHAEATRAAWREAMRARLVDGPVRVTTRTLAVLPTGSDGE